MEDAPRKDRAGDSHSGLPPTQPGLLESILVSARFHGDDDLTVRIWLSSFDKRWTAVAKETRVTAIDGGRQWTKRAKRGSLPTA